LTPHAQRLTTLYQDGKGSEEYNRPETGEFRPRQQSSQERRKDHQPGPGQRQAGQHHPAQAQQRGGQPPQHQPGLLEKG
jgi:hypothetical protein